MAFLLLTCLGALGLAACGQSTSSTAKASAGACTQASGISQTANTPSYKMVLDIGPREAMYTPAQAKAQHPTHGEVMLRGQMTDMGKTGSMGAMGNMGNMGASASARHLEVHICDRSTGQVAANLQPAITLVDNSAANMTDHLPTAVMQGVISPHADVHYGNNVTMPPSRRFTVMVTVGDQHATFHVKTPSAS
ncbi:MAG: hypothetical protein M3071_20310 [Actinomycetota bacterium]|nr:hypothetical protein [Actinomycetota bacterium]